MNSYFFWGKLYYLLCNGLWIPAKNEIYKITVIIIMTLWQQIWINWTYILSLCLKLDNIKKDGSMRASFWHSALKNVIRSSHVFLRISSHFEHRRNIIHIIFCRGNVKALKGIMRHWTWDFFLLQSSLLISPDCSISNLSFNNTATLYTQND
jgi:hypothetical protein